MRITIEGASRAPSWSGLQEIIRDALRQPAGVFTKIKRLDGGANYIAHGEYALTFRGDWEETEISLTVS